MNRHSSGPESNAAAVASARHARLRYVTDSAPGIHRVRRGRGFRYRRANGKSVRDPGTLKRIRSLVIPPAWTDVWICTAANGHLQATGRDARRRKQYRYHPRWQRTRDETKFDRMLDFGEALPRIRARVARDLSRPGLPREKVLATVIRLLERTLIRVGNEEYSRDNGSFGLTTMHNRHATISSGEIQFEFRGKSGLRHTISIRDQRLGRIVRKCRDLPGHRLFQYRDERGHRHTISSADVNAYLRQISALDFTAKDFRTWAGTVLAARTLAACGSVSSRRSAEKSIVKSIDVVAQNLSNTRAVCRKCYVHPAILDAFRKGVLPRAFRRNGRDVRGLRGDERALLKLLKRT